MRISSCITTGRRYIQARHFLTLCAVLFFIFAAVVQAQACEVPVCDIAGELKNMESKGQNYRFQSVSKLRQDYSKEKDEKKLKNLLEFARAAVELIKKIGDEDYVLREAKGLRDQSLFLLVQWVWRDCKTLSDAYAELAGETQRFAALDFFLRNAQGIRDQAQITELVCFAEKAEGISLSLKDADYVSRQALQLAAALSTQLLEVVNGWEGAFRLTEIQGPLQSELDVLRFVLFSTGGDLGIVAALTHPSLAPVVYQRVSFIKNPQVLGSHQSFASSTPSVVEFNFSKDFSQVSGFLYDADRFSQIRFKAVRMSTVPTFARNPCLEDEVVGQFRTKVGDTPGILSVAAITPHQFAAIFHSEEGLVRIPFAFGRYNPQTGRLTFISLQANVPLAWRFVAEKVADGRCTPSGMGLSTFNGAAYPLTLLPVMDKK